ncbi:MAG TPA: metallophosphatase [Bacteroidales bacterium]|nr:metallophosphatase [Bacteroidales bacterium]HPS16556.1 metallophosphatase [Bacteroidales bacterium]
MKSNRRDFFKTIIAGGAFIGVSSNPLFALSEKKEYTKITLLHTNDTHSHIEPFPANDTKFPGMGGYARRSTIIKKIRDEEKNILLFDAGDIFQGTPYYNMYGGELELKLMSLMGYDAATLGNHEFDNGLKGIDSNLHNATFPFINSNYDFSKTLLAGKISEYKIFEKDGIKIGVFGLGTELAGLVDKKNYAETIYNNPFEKAAYYAHLLKKEKNCDLVVCLSHLGYDDEDNTGFCDMELAKQSKNIDVIIGGHTHTFIDKPYKFFNTDKKEVYICQVGWGGVKLGRIDFYINKQAKTKFVEAYTIKIFNNQG